MDEIRMNARLLMCQWEQKMIRPFWSIVNEDLCGIPLRLALLERKAILNTGHSRNVAIVGCFGSVGLRLIGFKMDFFVYLLHLERCTLTHSHHIDSLENPFLEPYRTLRRTEDHQKRGIFVAEGEKVIARLMESELEIVSALITEDWLHQYKDRLEARKEDIEVFIGAKSLLNSIVGFHLHQGIMAVAKIPATIDLETAVQRSTAPLLFVAVDGLTNSENLGVVVRNCVAFGVQALVVGETSSSPYLRRSVRNSMGTIFKLPVVETSDLAATIETMKSGYNIRVIAAHPHSLNQMTDSSRFLGDCCIVLGSEGSGISEPILAACTDAVAIPMKRDVDSLNVSSASAVLLYEVMRQRQNLS